MLGIHYIHYIYNMEKSLKFSSPDPPDDCLSLMWLHAQQGEGPRGIGGCSIIIPSRITDMKILIMDMI